MAIIDTQGLILTTLKYGESSLIFKAFTKEEGRIDYIINGVRKPKSKISPIIIQPSFFIHITSYSKGNNSLNRVKEIKAKHIYKIIPFDMVRRSIALFSTELINKVLTQNQENQELFDFIEHYFLFLDDINNEVQNMPLLLLAKLWHYFGIFPDIATRNTHNTFFDMTNGVFTKEKDNNHLIVNREESEVFYRILKLDFSNLTDLKLSRQDRKKIIQNAIGYYQYHLPYFKKIKSLQILEEILEA